MPDIKNMRRTNNDIFRQLEELTVENERLKKENRDLRAENRWLRSENARLTQRLETLEATIEDRINKAVEEAIAKATAPLLETIAGKDRKILRLKSQIANNIINSQRSSNNSQNRWAKIPPILPNLQGAMVLNKFQITAKKVNGTTTVLTASPNKTEDSVAADNILTQFHGIVAQDHEAKFYNFGDFLWGCFVMSL